MRIHLSLIILLASFASASAQEDASDETSNRPDERENDARASLPPLLEKRLAASGLNVTYSIDFGGVNPFYLQGDFDGDGRIDYVTRLKPKKGESLPQDVVFLATGAVRWLSKDVGSNYPGPSWYVVFKTEKILKSFFEDENTPVPKLGGDAIMMVRPGSSSALVYWNGKRFDLYWQSD